MAEVGVLNLFVSALVGGLAGLFGGYWKDKLTDKRKASETEAKASKAFTESDKLAPDVLQVLRRQIAEDPCFREFNHSDQYSGFLGENMKNVYNKLSMLVAKGMLTRNEMSLGGDGEVFSTVQIFSYTMTEDFAKRLIASVK